MDLKDISKQIYKRIQDSKNILIICSRPVDPDSLGSGLTIKWWIENEFSKSSSLVIFSSIPEKLKSFPNLNQIDQSQVGKVNWEEYDLIILVDSSSWPLLLTNKYNEVLEKVGLDKFISIDHHTIAFMMMFQLLCEKMIYVLLKLSLTI